MARTLITLPTTCKWQPNDETSKDSSGTTYTDVAKGKLSDLATFNSQILSPNAEYLSGKVATSTRLTRTYGSLGTLSISGVPTPSEDEEGNKEPLQDIWGCKASRVDMPLEGYCGESVANPYIFEFNMWKQESDPDLAAAGSFKTADGVIHECTDATQALIAKAKRGVESVMRFAPVITRKRVWAESPDSIGTGLGRKDTPAAPGAIGGLTASWQFVKTQDDLDQQSDGTWVQNEAWMGAQSWDDNFYGTDPWTIPAFPNGGGN